MPFILKSGQGLLYMKVGNHAQEPLDDILFRKRKEIEEAGISFWGYGGNTCHPQTMVQPFARSYEERGGVIYLCMQPMESKHFAYPIRAKEFSVDGLKWEEIDPAINVVGSRYALLIRNLRQEEFDLALEKTRVALGNSKGLIGSQYIIGRVDKACLEAIEEADPRAPKSRVRIHLMAELVKPYAVYVRN